MARAATVASTFAAIIALAIVALCGTFYIHHYCMTSDPPAKGPLLSRARVDATKDSANANMTLSKLEHQPTDTSCGSVSADLVIGVLASASNRSVNARRIIRKTWMTMPTPGARIAVRFVLARNADGSIPAAHLAESIEFKDIVFVDTFDSYKNLARKVTLFFRWAVTNCPTTPLIMKTDDDVFIHLGRLARRIHEVPQQRLYWGKMMRGVDARKDGQPLPDNYQASSRWPHYASGAGYVLSSDVARAVAEPRLAPQFVADEDRAIGIALFGFNITYLDDYTTFRPWGNCIPDAILLHYQRMPELIERRWRRAIAGRNICGEPFGHDEICTKARQGHQATWKCSPGKKITAVIGATFGRVYSSGAGGSCGEGAEGLEPLPWCHAPNTAAVVRTLCIGKTSCSIAATNEVFGGDPCKGETKHLLAAVKCG